MRQGLIGRVPDALRCYCGDRITKISGLKDPHGIQGYPCKTGFALEEIGQAARTLRSDRVFIELLRWPSGDIKSQLVKTQQFLSKDVRNHILCMAEENRR